jgi:hypothetical protein
MTDNELRGIILKKFYELRREGNLIPKPEDFDPTIPAEDLYRICEQLGHHNLLLWRSEPVSGQPFLGSGKISAYGVDVIENNEEAPIGITFSQNISISHSQGIQIGNHNIQSFVSAVEQIILQIDQSNSSENEKEEAKSKLKAFLTHPLVASIIGGATSGLIGLLK